MKIAVIGDLHWGARNDNQEFLNYFQRFFDNVFFPELEERGSAWSFWSTLRTRGMALAIHQDLFGVNDVEISNELNPD